MHVDKADWITHIALPALGEIPHWRNKLALRALVNGVVVALSFQAVGGIIEPSDLIIHIAPKCDELIVEA